MGVECGPGGRRGVGGLTPGTSDMTFPDPVDDNRYCILQFVEAYLWTTHTVHI